MQSVREQLQRLDKDELVALVFEVSRMVLVQREELATLRQQQTLVPVSASASASVASTSSSSGTAKLRGGADEKGTTLSALEALAVSLSQPPPPAPTLMTADEIFAKYQVNEDAKTKFAESKRLGLSGEARQAVLDTFVQRIGASQGRSVLALLQGGGTTEGSASSIGSTPVSSAGAQYFLVNNSKLFVKCLRDVEQRYSSL